jgi:hypothetical protein
VPSYRLEVEIGDLLPGRSPEQVMDAAVSALGFHIDATDITVVAGTPRIQLRFTVPPSSSYEEDSAARTASRQSREAVEDVATTGRYRLLRRYHGTWLALG